MKAEVDERFGFTFFSTGVSWALRGRQVKIPFSRTSFLPSEVPETMSVDTQRASSKPVPEVTTPAPVVEPAVDEAAGKDDSMEDSLLPSAPTREKKKATRSLGAWR